MWRVRCVGCVCTCGVVCGVGGVCVLLWWRVCVVCGEAWHALSLSLSLLFSLLPLLSHLSFSLFFFFFLCSCSCSCSSSFLFPPSSFLLPPSNAQKKREGTKVLLKMSGRRGLWLRRWRLMSSIPLLSFLLDENILGK